MGKKGQKKKFHQPLKIQNDGEWCETCSNPASKCVGRCTGSIKSNEFNSNYNNKKS
jgi:hypothetical protein